MTPGPWKVVDSTSDKKGYIHIQGPNGEKIADIFPFAGVGGVGVEQARENAAFIVRSRNGGDTSLQLLHGQQEPAPNAAAPQVPTAGYVGTTRSERPSR